MQCIHDEHWSEDFKIKTNQDAFTAWREDVRNIKETACSDEMLKWLNDWMQDWQVREEMMKKVDRSKMNTLQD